MGRAHGVLCRAVPRYHHRRRCRRRRQRRGWEQRTPYKFAVRLFENFTKNCLLSRLARNESVLWPPSERSEQRTTFPAYPFLYFAKT